ncbi:hypothetical protein [Parabacteroides provencensis]|uniref:hypothetical protein n=1 Tax=Parabacteroides provencensis TaxID=1944636 RepID=UPI000C15E8A8|nr:hypothetical protein [Parabacteroides provencensis]
MATQTNKTHGLFWSLLKNVEGYNSAYKDVIKDGLVYKYSDQKTTSLNELYEKYPDAYCRMIEDLKGTFTERQERYYDGLDKERKRVIAAICGWIDKVGYKFDNPSEKIVYAKAVACRAANCALFNKIPASRLTAISFLYSNKTDVCTDQAELSSIIFKN